MAALLAAAELASGFGLHGRGDTNRSGSSAKPSPHATEVYAVWYDVPRASLARRRAGKTELTAAHNRLPLGTLVRVTNPKNGKSVFVRITDRGITHRRAKIDICKEAAIELGIVREGMARVWIEVIGNSPPKTASAGGG